MSINQSYWIWNYGDYEIFHANAVNTRRQQLGADVPCFWHLYDIERNVSFYQEFETTHSGHFKLYLNGMGCIMVDGKRFASETDVPLAAGHHTLKICVTNLTGLPAAYMESDICHTDGTWYTLDADNNKTPVGFSENHRIPSSCPEIFPFQYERIFPCQTNKIGNGYLFDFGKEYFGFLYLQNVDPGERIHVSYGESKEEALDIEYAILFEDVSGQSAYQLRQRAFRYIFITGAEHPEVYADFEYLPLDYKGSFLCDNPDTNRIWDMCAYTLLLTSREVQLEAVKRDRWLWGGDAYQAYKFSNYLFFDKDIVKRSTIALRGKDPVLEHINTITDYSFFWVIGLKEYYLTYKDTEFIRFIYPRAVSLMDFASKRVNQDGFITGQGNDWIFIDWSDIDKDGATSSEQLLYIAANRAMEQLADVVGADGSVYQKIADEHTLKTNQYFWKEEKGAYIDTYESGKEHITRHANIFAILYDIATIKQQNAIIQNVLLNDQISPITTPYFEGYELDVFGKIGYLDYIENKINTYWKGMLDLGATTVWEEFNPALSGTAHYEMYGGKYEKSLCHAWGASPIYLLGKYFLGVSPETPGFDTFTVKPNLGHFNYIRGTVPINGGEVQVHLSKSQLRVLASRNGGELVWNSNRYSLYANEEFILNY